jgi:hypothetical protein
MLLRSRDLLTSSWPDLRNTRLRRPTPSSTSSKITSQRLRVRTTRHPGNGSACSGASRAPSPDLGNCPAIFRSSHKVLGNSVPAVRRQGRAIPRQPRASSLDVAPSVGQAQRPDKTPTGSHKERAADIEVCDDHRGSHAVPEFNPADLSAQRILFSPSYVLAFCSGRAPSARPASSFDGSMEANRHPLTISAAANGISARS